MENNDWVVIPIRFHKKQAEKLRKRKGSIAEIIRALVDRMK